MLRTDTVEDFTLELLIKICKHPVFKTFHLVGGTALSLQLGHRISVDLDFFTPEEFDEKSLSETLIKEFDAEIHSIKPNSISGEIKKVKFDFIAHQYPSLEQNIEDIDIRLASLKDIAAMKINAIRNRGSKKDFVDLHFLLQHFSISEILEFADSKYPNHVRLLTLKSMVYFSEADSQPDCEMLIPISWNEIKQEINEMTLRFV